MFTHFNGILRNLNNYCILKWTLYIDMYIEMYIDMYTDMYIDMYIEIYIELICI